MVLYRQVNTESLLPSSGMLKAFVCASLGLRRCTYGCLFFGGHDDSDKKCNKVFFKNGNCIMVFIGCPDCNILLCL